MTTENIAHPPIAPHDEWLAARKQLLAREKEATRARDAVSAARRRLPMVRVEKDYTFTGPDGQVSLQDSSTSRKALSIAEKQECLCVTRRSVVVATPTASPPNPPDGHTA